MTVEIDGNKIEYIKAGKSSNKILLLHGWGCSINTFMNITNYLSKFMEVYVIDLPRIWKK